MDYPEKYHFNQYGRNHISGTLQSQYRFPESGGGQWIHEHLLTEPCAKERWTVLLCQHTASPREITENKGQ